MDLSKPTALELKWRAQAAHAQDAIALVERRFDSVLDSLKLDSPASALETALRALSNPLHDLAAEAGGTIHQIFGRAVHRLCGEAAIAAEREGSSARLVDLKEKMHRVLGYFQVLAERKSLSLSETDLTAGCGFLLSGAGSERYYQFISGTKFNPVLSSEFTARDAAIRSTLIAPICAHESIVDGLTPERIERVMDPESRLRIFRATSEIVSSGYGIPPLEITFAAPGQVPPPGLLAAYYPRSHQIVLNPGFKTEEVERLPQYTFLTALRYTRHAIQMTMAKAVTTEGGSGAASEGTQIALPLAREFPNDARAFAVGLLNRQEKRIPPTGEILFTTQLKFLLDTDALAFSEAVLNGVADTLDPV